MSRGWRCSFLLGAAALAIATAGTPQVQAEPGDKTAPNAESANAFSGTSVKHAKAVVMPIDTGRNSITLLEGNGESYEVMVDRNIGNVGNLQLGDMVSATFSRALLLRADKSSSSGIRERIDKGYATGPSLRSSLSMYRVEAVTTAVEVDRDKRLLTLRGPTRTVVLQASSDSLLDGLIMVFWFRSTPTRIAWPNSTICATASTRHAVDGWENLTC